MKILINNYLLIQDLILMMMLISGVNSNLDLKIGDRS